MKKFILILFKKLYYKFSDSLNPLVILFYQKIARENFNVKIEVVKVKKGKAKFFVAFFETIEGKHRVVLGRHSNSQTYNY